MARRFCKLVALLACLAVGQAFAGLTLLSPTPQHAMVGQTFAPLEVWVTDTAGNPVAGVSVRYSWGPSSTLTFPSYEGCIIDLGFMCTATTDSQGVARTRPFTANRTNTQPERVRFNVEGQFDVVVIAELFVDTVVPPVTMSGIRLLSPTPQRAKVGGTFAPLEVRVTDAAGNPRANTRVQYTVPYQSPVDTESYAGDCVNELGTFCSATTNAQGIARTLGFRTINASQQPARIRFSLDGQPDSVTAELYVDPVVPPMSLSVLSGANQSTAVGTGYAQPFVVQVLTPSGAPIPGIRVNFSGFVAGSALTLDFNGAAGVGVTTDANGTASAFPRVKMGVGAGILRAQMIDPVANMALSVDIPLSATTAGGRSDLDLENLWWGGSAENGWGVSIAQRSDRLFPVLYVYDDNGNPTWRVIEDAVWGNGQRYEYFRGNQYKPKGSPYYAYDASRFDVGARGADTVITFTSEIAASVQFRPDPNAPGTQTEPISPLDFGPDVPPRLPGIGGMWWGGPSQAGWGVSIMEQPGGVFAVWFTYDANGDPTWFFMPTGSWENATTYSGTLYKTHSSPWFGGNYDPSKLTITSVGTFRFRFVNTDNATFEWTAEGHSGSSGLVKIEF